MLHKEVIKLEMLHLTMSKGRARRERIFRKYAENFKSYLQANERTILLVENGTVTDVTGQVYCCPLCFDYFFIQHTEDLQNKNFLTLEHNPPKSMGGRDSILTCKNCNSTHGATRDKLALDLLITESFLNRNNGSIKTNFTLDGHAIKGTVQKFTNKLFIKPDPKSNPRALENFKEKIRKGKTFSFDHNLREPNWDEYSLVMLKIAYLKGFESFGYCIADFGNGANIRDVLRKKMDYPIFNNGVIDMSMEDKYLGVHMVIDPEDLKAIIVTQKLKYADQTGMVEKNVSVILPLPHEPGWESLKNYNIYRNKLIKFSTKEIVTEDTPIQNTNAYYEKLGMKRLSNTQPS